jgi:hypothetical protein
VEGNYRPGCGRFNVVVRAETPPLWFTRRSPIWFHQAARLLARVSCFAPEQLLRPGAAAAAIEACIGRFDGDDGVGGAHVVCDDASIRRIEPSIGPSASARICECKTSACGGFMPGPHNHRSRSPSPEVRTGGTGSGYPRACPRAPSRRFPSAPNSTGAGGLPYFSHPQSMQIRSAPSHATIGPPHRTQTAGSRRASLGFTPAF